jgi:excisionase family DNA binding protein
MTSPHLIDAKQVAEHLSVSLRTVRSWTKTGRLPSRKAGPKLVRYDVNEVDEALRWADAAQVAQHFGVTLRTVRRWTKDNTIPAHRIGPKLLRFDLAEVDAALRGAQDDG